MSYEKLKKLEEKVSEAAKVLDKLRREKAALEKRCNEFRDKLSKKEAEFKSIKSHSQQFEPIIEDLIKKLESLNVDTLAIEAEAAQVDDLPAKEAEPKAAQQVGASEPAVEYQAHFDLGNVYEEKGMYEEAITEYQKAIEINPNYIEAVEHLAFLLEKLNREDEATPLWEKVLAFKKPR